MSATTHTASSSDADAETGIGLPVIETLTHSVQFADTPGGGTEVRMTFASPSLQGMPSDGGEPPQPPAFDRPEHADTAALSIAPVALAAAVVPRLLCVLAARAHFSTDRISDSQLLADALVAHAAESISGSHMSLVVDVEPRDLELHVGPLIAGRAERLVADSDVEGLGSVLEKLADGHGVRTSDSHDTLTLTLRDRAEAL
jgi:hypothetical protein